MTSIPIGAAIAARGVREVRSPVMQHGAVARRGPADLLLEIGRNS
jgi:hypothetical protein